MAGALGYVVQASTDATFDDAILGNAETVLFDGLPFTTETSYTAADLEAGTTPYVRVAAAGTPAAPLVSAFTAHVTGMTLVTAPPLASTSRASFEGGTWLVGEQVERGVYAAETGGGCYRERRSGFGGTVTDDVLATSSCPVAGGR